MCVCAGLDVAGGFLQKGLEIFVPAFPGTFSPAAKQSNE